MIAVSASTMQQLDQRTIAAGTPGIDLMERAGSGATHIIVQQFPTPCRVAVLCGKGNNGGDGFVVARLLSQKGYHVSVILLSSPDDLSGDARTNFERLDPAIVHSVTGCHDLSSVQGIVLNAELVVDAILGTGLTASVRGLFREAILLTARIPRENIISLDIPSGVDGTSGAIHGCAVAAGHTITFGFPKTGLIWYPGALQTGTIHTVSIGIPEHYLQQVATVNFLDQSTVAARLKERPLDAHKGTFGHLCVIAGSTGKSGAAALCTNAAVRGGCGLVTAAVPHGIHQVMEMKTTEAMTVSFDGPDVLSDTASTALMALVEGKEALAIGPGIGTAPVTHQLLRLLLETIQQPVVLDADALNLIADDQTLLASLSGKALVMTPHPGELRRLTGQEIPIADQERFSFTRATAQRLGVTLVLKGAHTVIASPDGAVAVNTSGNQGMASGGMGDVLTGLTGALLAQGYQPFDAACIAAHVHGLAADRVANRQGIWGMAASDLLSEIPYIFQQLMTQRRLP